MSYKLKEPLPRASPLIGACYESRTVENLHICAEHRSFTKAAESLWLLIPPQECGRPEEYWECSCFSDNRSVRLTTAGKYCIMKGSSPEKIESIESSVKNAGLGIFGISVATADLKIFRVVMGTMTCGIPAGWRCIPEHHRNKPR